MMKMKEKSEMMENTLKKEWLNNARTNNLLLKDDITKILLSIE